MSVCVCVCLCVCVCIYSKSPLYAACNTTSIFKSVQSVGIHCFPSTFVVLRRQNNTVCMIILTCLRVRSR